MLNQIDPYFIAAVFAGVIALGALIWGLRLQRHLHADEDDIVRLEKVAFKATEILASSPDGLFIWDHDQGGITCSRRLAVLLNLEKGTQARYDDIRNCFRGHSLELMEQSVSLLRDNGTPFEILIKTETRYLQAYGMRSESEDGNPISDLVWMRDVSNVAQKSNEHLAAEATKNIDDPNNDNTNIDDINIDDTNIDDRHLTTLLDALPLPLWIRAKDLSIAFINKAGEAFDTSKVELAAVAQNEQIPASGMMKRHLGGVLKIVEVTEIPLGNQQINAGTLGFAIDRTHEEQKNTEFASRTAAQETALSNLTAAIAIFNGGARLIFSNTSYATLWDLNQDWLQTRPTLSEIYERLREKRRLPEVADFKLFKDSHYALFKTLEDTVKNQLHLPDGRTLNCSISPYGDGGLVFGYEDQSDRLNLESSYKVLDAVQKETFDNLHEGIIVISSTGRLKLVNPVFIQAWQVDEKFLVGEPHISEIIDAIRPLYPHPTKDKKWDDDTWIAERDHIVSKFLSREPSRGQLVLTNGNVLDYANVPLPDGAMLCSYIDVTDSNKVEIALRQRADALQQANRQKSEFISNVSVEIQKPLRNIIDFSELLRKGRAGDLNRRQTEYANGIHKTSKDLLFVIGDILDLAAIDSRQMELNLQDTDLHSLLSGALTSIQERITQKRMYLDFDCPSDLKPIEVDPRRIKQSVLNLLSNAITYTPSRGRIGLSVIQTEKETIITVSDTGIGIPTADREQIFLPFKQGPLPEKETRGPGLSLTLVKKFVDLHKGRIELKSNPGKGTKISVHLPNSAID